MSCKLSDKCDNVFACNVLRPEVELLGCSFYKPKKPMTNEDWLKQANTEQLATFLAIVQYDGTDLTLKKNHVEKWVAWLKEKHHAE